MQLLLLFTLFLAVQAALPCASNQYTDKKGDCQVCPTNCVTCATANTCSSCTSNYYVVSNS